MPLNLSTGKDLVGAPEFQYRVAMAFYFVARQVLAEDTAVEGHEVRANFARSIALQDYTAFTQYSAMVATDSAIVAGGPYPPGQITSQPPDDRIIAAVSGMWNWLAGVPQTRPI